MDSYYNKLLFNHFDVYFIPTSSIHSLHMSIKIKLHLFFVSRHEVHRITTHTLHNAGR